MRARPYPYRLLMALPLSLEPLVDVLDVVDGLLHEGRVPNVDEVLAPLEARAHRRTNPGRAPTVHTAPGRPTRP